MNVARFIIGIALLLAAAGVTASPQKTLVCHVGNTSGPGGETYLDDPTCVPGEANGYFCPDAGKIDLIVVPNAANHLDNPNHSWDGISDYEPAEVGATGEGTEDSDGNGIDDGCEPPQTCPCWSEWELQAVTAANQDTSFSCSYGGASNYPMSALIQSTTPDTFFALVGDVVGACGDSSEIMPTISLEEAGACISQIAQRCAEIGTPIVP